MIIHSPFLTLEPYPEVPLHHFLAQTAIRHPERPALIFVDGQRFSYHRLYQASRSLARMLQDGGLQRGERVALYSPNCPEYAVVTFATSMAGGTLTTLNPLYRVREVVSQLADAGAKILFYHPMVRLVVDEVQPELPSVTLVSLADVWTIADQTPSEPYPVTINPREDLAALFYSSGTTGLPKGVMLTHFNIVANIRQACACFGTIALTRPLAFLPFFHIYGFTLILNTTLAVGGTCVVTPSFDPKMVLELIQQQQITNLPTVPAALLALVNQPGAEQHTYNSLRLVLCGAYAVPAEIERRAKQLFPGATFVEGYGLTEASPLTNLNPLGYVRSGTFGVPVSDTLEQVVSLETGSPSILGEPGELWVKGPQVMKGYWQRPAESAQALSPDGWLRTGDLVRADGDGYVTFVERLKEMIKYRGYQIAPAELEAVLLEHPAVLDVTVVPKPDPETGEAPKAFVQRRLGVTVSAEELMTHVERRVAPYKKIREVEFVETIPKTASGKTLRRQFIELERQRAGQTRSLDW
jgi:acyl-CoA synthetase (AMP-forming)/AMP-acid ligase II